MRSNDHEFLSQVLDKVEDLPEGLGERLLKLVEETPEGLEAIEQRSDAIRKLIEEHSRD
jgi:hypothetical protein